MKKLIFPFITLTVITAFSAHAETYTLNQAEHNAPQYITVEGERYVRVPTQHPQYLEYNGTRYARIPTPNSTPKHPQQKTPQHYKLTPQPSPVKNFFSLAPRFYIGADYSFNDTKISSYQELGEILLDDKNTAYSGVIGLKFNPYISFEAFYQKSDDAKKHNHLLAGKQEDLEEDISPYDAIEEANIDTTLSYVAYGADLLFTLPLHEKIDLVFGPGYAYYDFDMDTTINIHHNISSHNFITHFSDSHSTGAIRYNAGLQFEVYKDLYLRAAARYVKFEKKSILKDMKELSLGLRYVF